VQSLLLPFHARIYGHDVLDYVACLNDERRFAQSNTYDPHISDIVLTCKRVLQNSRSHDPLPDDGTDSLLRNAGNAFEVNYLAYHMRRTLSRRQWEIRDLTVKFRESASYALGSVRYLVDEHWEELTDAQKTHLSRELDGLQKRLSKSDPASAQYTICALLKAQFREKA
jgi:hypothetical protein